MSKKVVIEVQAKTAELANREAVTRVALSLARQDKTVKVLRVSTQYLSARSDAGRLTWLLECTAELGRPALVPMPV